MCHYPDLGRASDWSNQVFPMAQPIRSTTQIWVVTHRISALVSQRSFGRETGGSVSKCWLFSQAIDSVYVIVTASSAKKKKYDSKNLKTFSRWSIDGDHFTIETADNNNNNKSLTIFIKRPFPRVQKVLYAVKI